MTLTASTHVATATPGRYIGRLCKHFAHKIPVQYDETSGRIEFEIGLCLLAAENDGLTLRVESADDANLEKLKHVVASHFERFAWQEALTLEWR
ncbi:DUF2218 domain-containing protein [Zestomonas carbonaria]|uniref:2,4-dihydroxyhept-2-ene-1,7-dioic acid aldolase n=1 Tax=Zestomonas carbonaria TaxID=2762745 RepID=A0A7U7EM86_9GAMM|nr:DUF2218 domain-containing protein [Pseudomonas carbonaria]CAD5107248.1 hypothetical protein PSEWESI4_01519 [Pseudomonas carbonaria]